MSALILVVFVRVVYFDSEENEEKKRSVRQTEPFIAVQVSARRVTYTANTLFGKLRSRKEGAKKRGAKNTVSTCERGQKTLGAVGAPFGAGAHRFLRLLGKVGRTI